MIVCRPADVYKSSEFERRELFSKQTNWGIFQSNKGQNSCIYLFFFVTHRSSCLVFLLSSRVLLLCCDVLNKVLLRNSCLWKRCLVSNCHPNKKVFSRRASLELLCIFSSVSLSFQHQWVETAFRAIKGWWYERLRSKRMCKQFQQG